MYRLLFDPELADQWFIDTPMNSSGDEWSFWRLLGGASLEGSDWQPWRARVKQLGQRLPFSFAGFDVPVVATEIAEQLAPILGEQAQFPVLDVAGEEATYRILVATRTVQCVDEEESQFIKWGPSDGRPDKCGEYRMFTRLRLDPARVPSDTRVFRVWGWSQALIVTEPVAVVLKSCVPLGLKYEPVV
jgi:hypothetical protein